MFRFAIRFGCRKRVKSKIREVRNQIGYGRGSRWYMKMVGRSYIGEAIDEYFDYVRRNETLLPDKLINEECNRARNKYLYKKQ